MRHLLQTTAHIVTRASCVSLSLSPTIARCANTQQFNQLGAPTASLAESAQAHTHARTCGSKASSPHLTRGLPSASVVARWRDMPTCSSTLSLETQQWASHACFCSSRTSASSQVSPPPPPHYQPTNLANHQPKRASRGSVSSDCWLSFVGSLAGHMQNTHRPTFGHTLTCDGVRWCAMAPMCARCGVSSSLLWSTALLPDADESHCFYTVSSDDVCLARQCCGMLDASAAVVLPWCETRGFLWCVSPHLV
jgi:hypothetical protein